MKFARTVAVLLAAIAASGKKVKHNFNHETTPFWLQDIGDGMCLGPDGFGACDASSIWILARTHPTKDTKAFVSMLAPEAGQMCLGSLSTGYFSSSRRVGVSKCGDRGTKNLQLSDLGVQGDVGFLLAQGDNCLARAQGKLRNSAHMQLCTKGTPLQIVETPIHIAGMQIETVDNHCFDGHRFRPCNDGDPTLRWGIGLDFRKQDPSRHLFCFFDQTTCASRDGEAARKDDCSSKGAMRWGWRGGRLSQGETHCLARTRENTAIFVPCSEGYETVSFTTPDIAPVKVQSSRHTDREMPFQQLTSPLSDL